MPGPGDTSWVPSACHVHHTGQTQVPLHVPWVTAMQQTSPRVAIKYISRTSYRSDSGTTACALGRGSTMDITQGCCQLVDMGVCPTNQSIAKQA